MNVNLVELVAREVVLFTGCADIGFFENEELGIVADQGPDTDVKFSLPEQQRSLNILLNDERAVLELFALWLRLCCAFFLLVLGNSLRQLLHFPFLSFTRSLDVGVR